jgi:hypothetical protein
VPAHSAGRVVGGFGSAVDPSATPGHAAEDVAHPCASRAGAAGNISLTTGQPVRLADPGLDLTTSVPLGTQ